jgi:peroxidase
MKDGKMRMSKSYNGDLLPINYMYNGNEYLENRYFGNPESSFVSGDIRANEVTSLLAFHVIFYREHNRLADEIAKAARSLNYRISDESIWRLARYCNIMQYQAIVFGEWLPAVLGNHAPNYKNIKYNKWHDASISLEFVATVMRFGHSLVSNHIDLINQRGRTEKHHASQTFFNSSYIYRNGVDDILRGLASKRHYRLDCNC